MVINKGGFLWEGGFLTGIPLILVIAMELLLAGTLFRQYPHHFVLNPTSETTLQMSCFSTTVSWEMCSWVSRTVNTMRRDITDPYRCIFDVVMSWTRIWMRRSSHPTTSVIAVLECGEIKRDPPDNKDLVGFGVENLSWNSDYMIGQGVTCTSLSDPTSSTKSQIILLKKVKSLFLN